MGTIVIVVEYKRGVQLDYGTFEGSGTDYDSVFANTLEKAKKHGWKIIDVRLISNTFDRQYSI